MDELAQYTVAKLAQKYGAEVIMHDQTIPQNRRPWYQPCEFHDDTFLWSQPVQCDKLFHVAHDGLKLERFYLYGQCIRCNRVHVFFSSEIIAT